MPADDEGLNGGVASSHTDVVRVRLMFHGPFVHCELRMCCDDDVNL